MDTEPRESPTYRSGHYKSLVPDHSQSLPRCCVPSSVCERSEVPPSPTENRPTAAVMAECKILEVLSSDPDIVMSSLSRLTNISNITVEDLFETRIAQILHQLVWPKFAVENYVEKYY